MATDAETTLSAAELRDLGNVAATMIPPSAEAGMPGADDPAILADIAKSLGRDLALVRAALALYVADQMNQRLANLFD